MLYVSLFFVLVLLWFAWPVAREPGNSAIWYRFLLWGGVTSGLSCSLLVPAVFALLAVALCVWPLVRARVRTFAPLAAVAVAIPYGCVSRDAMKDLAEHQQVQREYPFESLAARTPEPRTALRTPPAGLAATEFDGFENAVEKDIDALIRSRSLQQLHASSVDTFVNNPGFGVFRMVPSRITDERLKGRPDPTEPPAQPGSPVPWSDHEPLVPAQDAERTALRKLHGDGLLDFVNARGWGYIKDRDRVAGFLSHRFSKVPEVESWQVERIDLIGLLKHPEPVVYVSEKLPAMSELQNAPTRKLDPFEARALEPIRGGDDLFAARRGDVARVVGALRSTKQCVGCHGGTRGDLLGAFSYTLRAR